VTASAPASQATGDAPPVGDAAPAPPATGGGEAPPVLRIPSLSNRVAWASGRAALTIVVLVVVPAYALSLVEGLGVQTPIALGGIAVLGIAFAVLGALRYISRPTRAYGPLSIGASLVSLVYLLYLIPIASIGFQHANDVSIAIDFGRFLRYCLIAPLFGIAAGAVTSVEDFLRPGERVRYEYAL